MRQYWYTLQNVLAMAVVAAKRLRHHLGLTVSTLVGIISVLSLVICVPVFTNAVLSQVLKQTLIDKSVANHRSLFSLHAYYRDDGTNTALTAQNADTVTRWLNQQFTEKMGLQVTNILAAIRTEVLVFKPVKYQSSKPPFIGLHLYLMHTNLVETQTRLVEGAWPTTAEAATATGPVPVAVEESYADDKFLNVGDILQADNLTIEIVGIFRAIDPSDLSWFYSPATTFNNTVWVPQEYFSTRLGAVLPEPVDYASWYAIVADDSLRFNQALDYTRTMIRLQTDLQAMLPEATIDYSPLDELKAYDARRLSLTLLFYAAGAPLVLLALIFISLTAAIALQQLEQETTTLRGRGVTLRQVFGLNVVESVVLILLALPFAVLVGVLAARAMGTTTLFLQFTRQSSLVFALKDINLLWLGGVGLVILIARCIPLLGLRHTTAVSLKQERSRNAKRPVWERYFLDFLLLIPAGYAYWVLRNQLLTPVEGAAAASANTSAGQFDPLLFAASSIFAIAACMIGLRILPVLVRLLARLSERFFPTGPYLAIQELARRPQEHASVTLLIMISLSLAIYSASMAKTLDRWMHDARYYQAGADLVIRAYELPTPSNGDPLIGGAPAETGTPDLTSGAQSLVNLEALLRVDGIRSATNVGRYNAQAFSNAGSAEIELVGIDRLSFPATAYFRTDFSDQSLGALMNALAAVPNGVLVEPSYLESTGLRIGDGIRVSASIGMLGQGFNEAMVIVGSYTYFPTVYPSKTPTMIANLGELFGTPEAATDYEVWLSIQDGASVRAVVDDLQKLAHQNGQAVHIRQNALLEIQTVMGQPEWVGLFGILSVGFLLTGLMPSIGFVLDTFASLRKHFVQLGILMAVGMPKAQVIGYLVLERLLLMGIAMAGGTGIGFMLCVLFIPLLQINAAGTSPVPPFEVLIGWTESTWLIVAFGVVLLIVVIGTISYLVQIKIFQAVKLGEAA